MTECFITNCCLKSPNNTKKWEVMKSSLKKWEIHQIYWFSSLLDRVWMQPTPWARRLVLPWQPLLCLWSLLPGSWCWGRGLRTACGPPPADLWRWRIRRPQRKGMSPTCRWMATKTPPTGDISNYKFIMENPTFRGNITLQSQWSM